MTEFSFSKIVVGVDGRAGGADALALARALARIGGGRLILACSYLVDPIGTRLVPAEARGLRETAIAYLEAAHAEAADVVSDTRPVPTSSPARGLHQVAEELGADLIVVGSSHRGAFGRIVPGSVTQQALHASPCAVAVAPAGLAALGETRLGRIGCAYDGGAEARTALAVAKELAAEVGASLEVIDVIAPLTPFPGYPVGPGLPETWEDLEKAVRDELDAAVESLGELPAVGVAPAGDPAEQLIQRSESLDLLVMGSRAYGPVRRVLLGTVAGRVVRDARCPVIVVPGDVDPVAGDEPSAAATATV